MRANKQRKKSIEPKKVSAKNSKSNTSRSKPNKEVKTKQIKSRSPKINAQISKSRSKSQKNIIIPNKSRVSQVQQKQQKSRSRKNDKIDKVKVIKNVQVEKTPKKQQKSVTGLNKPERKSSSRQPSKSQKIEQNQQQQRNSRSKSSVQNEIEKNNSKINEEKVQLPQKRGRNAQKQNNVIEKQQKIFSKSQSLKTKEDTRQKVPEPRKSNSLKRKADIEIIDKKILKKVKTDKLPNAKKILKSEIEIEEGEIIDDNSEFPSFQIAHNQRNNSNNSANKRSSRHASNNQSQVLTEITHHLTKKQTKLLEKYKAQEELYNNIDPYSALKNANKMQGQNTPNYSKTPQNSKSSQAFLNQNKTSANKSKQINNGESLLPQYQEQSNQKPGKRIVGKRNSKSSQKPLEVETEEEDTISEYQFSENLQNQLKKLQDNHQDQIQNYSKIQIPQQQLQQIDQGQSRGRANQKEFTIPNPTLLLQQQQQQEQQQQLQFQLQQLQQLQQQQQQQVFKTQNNDLYKTPTQIRRDTGYVYSSQKKYIDMPFINQNREIEQQQSKSPIPFNTGNNAVGSYKKASLVSKFQLLKEEKQQLYVQKVQKLQQQKIYQSQAENQQIYNSQQKEADPVEQKQKLQNVQYLQQKYQEQQQFIQQNQESAQKIQHLSSSSGANINISNNVTPQQQIGGGANAELKFPMNNQEIYQKIQKLQDEINPLLALLNNDISMKGGDIFIKNNNSNANNVQSSEKPKAVSFTPPDSQFKVQNNSRSFYQQQNNTPMAKPNIVIQEEFQQPDNQQQVGRKQKADWLCRMCKNINFSYRKLCNICKSPANEQHIAGFIHADIQQVALAQLVKFQHNKAINLDLLLKKRKNPPTEIEYMQTVEDVQRVFNLTSTKSSQESESQNSHYHQYGKSMSLQKQLQGYSQNETKIEYDEMQDSNYEQAALSKSSFQTPSTNKLLNQDINFSNQLKLQKNLDAPKFFQHHSRNIDYDAISFNVKKSK